MKEENLEIYEETVDKWSRLFKAKVGDLFTLEELAQEVWLAILLAEESDTYEDSGEASLETYLGTCIRNHLFRLVQNEVKHVSSLGHHEDDDVIDLHQDDVDEQVITVEIMDRLRDEVYHRSLTQYGMRYAPFVLEHMEVMSEREMAAEAKKRGLPVGKGSIHNTKKRIQKLYKEIAEV